MRRVGDDNVAFGHGARNVGREQAPLHLLYAALDLRVALHFLVFLFLFLLCHFEGIDEFLALDKIIGNGDHYEKNRGEQQYLECD